MKPIIAIDGPSCSGKGTISEKLADRFKFAYLDTGMLYRAFAYFELMSEKSDDIAEYKNPLSANDQNNFIAYFKDLNISTISSDTINMQNQVYFSENIIKHSRELIEEIKKIPKTIIRSEIVGMKASKIAKIQKIRDLIIGMIREFAYTHGDDYAGTIMDGRDIGTAVFPDADFKIYMTADIKTRAIRRLESIKEKNASTTFDEIYENMKNRDEYDSSHLVNPLNFDKKYITIDTSRESVETTFANLTEMIKEKFCL